MRIFLSILACAITLIAHAHAERLPVLIIDGQSNHDWQRTTPALQGMLVASGRFTPEVFSAINAKSWQAKAVDFRNYRAVVLNYYGEPWPAEVWSSFEKYVNDGGGLVVIHAALAAFPENDSYNRMIALGWRKAGQGSHLGFNMLGSLVADTKGGDSSHGAYGPFTIDLRSTQHAIVAGFPERWTHAPDELYHTLRGPARDLEILASAPSPVTKLHEPVLWTVSYGKGRVFCTSLGHDVRSMQGNGFQSSLTRGTEWAATGSVTLPAVKNAMDTTAAVAKEPSREVIEQHRDPNIAVTGTYAAVKLPLRNGPPLHNPSRIVSTPTGMVFVANYTGEILRLKDSDQDGLEDTAELFTNVAQIGLPSGQSAPKPGTVPAGPGLRYPTAMTYKDGWLYVGATQEIWRFEVKADGTCGKAQRFASGWPYTMHAFDWTFGMQFGKDGWLYAILCTDYLNPNPAPDPKGLRGSIIRISPDGTKFERFACGLRFAYGLAINEAGDIFFTDNAAGDNKVEELNHAVKDGNYGHHPKDPKTPASEPILAIKTDASSDGCSFNPTTNKRFGDTAGDLFIACWGNDGRWDKGGIARVRLTKRADGKYDAVEEPFAKGPAKVSDLTFAPNGDMYVARFGREASLHAPFGTPDGDVYRFIYSPWLSKGDAGPATNPLLAKAGDPVKGKEIFTQRACATCHTVDGSGTLLGPDLRSMGLTMDRAGLLESIENPSANIKTDYDTAKLTKKDGKELIGRIVASNPDRVTLMQPGNVKETTPRSDIRSVDMLPTSLMPPGLITGLSNADKDDLCAYIESFGREASVRVHAGGNAIRIGDSTYIADVPYRPGSYGYQGGLVAASTDPASPPTMAACRYGNFIYRFDASECEYEISLTFGECWMRKPGERIFSVLANGAVVISELDVLQEAGFNKPLTRTFRVKASKGGIVLDFQSKVNNAMVSLIEVKPVKSTQ